jgi:DNA-binding response OmpR family regulator
LLLTEAAPTLLQGHMLNIEIGPLRIEGGNRVFVNGHEVWLAHDEHRLLLHVAGRPGQVCLRQDLIGRGWDAPAQGNCSSVDNGIKRLRRKLGRAARMVETVRGLGYRLVARR